MNPCASSFNPGPQSHTQHEHQDELCISRGLPCEPRVGGTPGAQSTDQGSNPAVWVSNNEEGKLMTNPPTEPGHLARPERCERQIGNIPLPYFGMPTLPSWLLARQYDPMNQQVYPPAIENAHPFLIPRAYGGMASVPPDASRPSPQQHVFGSVGPLQQPAAPVVPVTVDQHLQTYYFPPTPAHHVHQQQHVSVPPISPALSTALPTLRRIQSNRRRSRSRTINRMLPKENEADDCIRATSDNHTLPSPNPDQLFMQPRVDATCSETEEPRRGRSKYRIVSSVPAERLLDPPAPRASLSPSPRRVSVSRDIHVAGGGSSCGPPSNAPKAPAALRRYPNEHPSSALPYPKPSTGAGSWSQSKRWVSDGTKERANYQRLMQSLHHLGADRSPFLPQTPRELTSFRVSQAETKKRVFAEKLRRLEGSEVQKEGSRPSSLKDSHGLEFTDGLSTVFAAVNCFNAHLSPQQHAAWPSLAEYKEHGDKRAARCGGMRYFPLPRLNFVAREFGSEDAARLYNSDGSIKWEKKAVQIGSASVLPITENKKPGPEIQLSADEVHERLRKLLCDIDGLHPQP